PAAIRGAPRHRRGRSRSGLADQGRPEPVMAGRIERSRRAHRHLPEEALTTPTEARRRARRLGTAGPTVFPAPSRCALRASRERGRADATLGGVANKRKDKPEPATEQKVAEELTEHLGHEKHDPAGNEAGNVRNGTRPKAVLTEASGQVGIEV